MSNLDKNICVLAVVVTYNRKKLLLECIDAILKQSYSVNKIILIDNNSNDGTYEALEENGYISNQKIEYVKMKANLGGSGGFYEGMKISKKYQYDWIWIMDDDTIPTPTCLEKLLEANKIVQDKNKLSQINEFSEPSFFASSIYGPDGEFMNLPEVSNRPSDNGYSYWYRFLKEGMVSISSATFVSILVKKEAINKCGLPCKDYFIWGDDTEYTKRLTRFFGDAYFVGDSIAIHKRIGAQKLDIERENNFSRIEMFHYFYRNQIINNKYYGVKGYPIKQLVKSFFKLILSVGNSLKFAKAKAKFKGTYEGIIQYKQFENYINSQLTK